MRIFRLKVWTGPSLAVEHGRRARRAGLRVPTTGTEHIYVDVEGSDCASAEHNMRATLMRKYKKDFGLRAASCHVRAKRK